MSAEPALPADPIPGSFKEPAARLPEEPEVAAAAVDNKPPVERLGEGVRVAPADLRDPALYLNRELSWLEFNRRVLEEAHDMRHPLLERVKFLAIFSTNLDEFYMIRVSGLKDQLAAGVTSAPSDGLTPAQTLAAIRERVLPMLHEQRRHFLRRDTARALRWRYGRVPLRSTDPRGA